MIQSQLLEFRNRRGLRLAALLDMPQGECIGTAVFVHCFTCNKGYRLNRHVSREFTAAGIAVMRFDLTGLGDSEGDFATTTFTSGVEDTLDASAFLAGHLPGPQCFLGHSLGGTMAIAAAAESEACHAVATINAPPSPAHVADQLASHEYEIDQRGSARVRIGDGVYEIRRQLIDDLRQQRIEPCLQGLQRPLMVLHAEHDRLVPLGLGERLFNMGRQPKSFVTLTGSDHLLGGKDDAAFAGRLLATWLGHQFGAAR